MQHIKWFGCQGTTMYLSVSLYLHLHLYLYILLFLYLFAHLDLLSTESFSSDFLSSDSFSSLPLPASAASSVHIVGSLTSKLPSITIFFINRGCSFLVYKNDPETQLGGTTSWPEGMVPLNFSGWLGWLVEDQSSLTTLGLPMIINWLVNSG